MIRILKKVGIKEIYLNISIVTYDKPIFEIILDGKKLKSLPLRSGTAKECDA